MKAAGSEGCLMTIYLPSFFQKAVYQQTTQRAGQVTRVCHQKKEGRYIVIKHPSEPAAFIIILSSSFHSYNNLSRQMCILFLLFFRCGTWHLEKHLAQSHTTKEFGGWISIAQLGLIPQPMCLLEYNAGLLASPIICIWKVNKRSYRCICIKTGRYTQLETHRR